MVGHQGAELDEIAHEFFVYSLIVFLSTDEPKTMRRNKRIASMSDRLIRVSRQVHDPTHQKT
jgi:hypothetical protein